MLRLIAYVLGIVAFHFWLTSPAQAGHWRPGGEIIALAYCVTLEDAVLLTEAAAKDGNVGYTRVMNSKRTRCYDSDLHRAVRPVAATLKRFAWSMVHADGVEFAFWVTTDRRGVEAYVWSPVKHGKET